MNSVLNIIGSIILFGIFMIAIISLDGNVSSTSHQTTLETGTQENIVALAELFDHDFLKIGHRKPAPKLKPGVTDSIRITWYSDIDNNGTMDSVFYYLGDKECNSPNPNTRILYRKINNANPGIVNHGIVSFNLSYYDSSMTQINYSNLNNITGINKVCAIKIRVRVESQYKIEKDYASTFWEKTYRPRSLAL